MGNPGRVFLNQMPVVFRRDIEALVPLQLVPDRQLRNYNVEALGKALAEFYSKPIQRITRHGRRVLIKAPDRFVFRIYLTRQRVQFFLLVPAWLVDHMRQRLAAVWERATALSADLPCVKLDPGRCSCAELIYRRHNIFSLKTDRDKNEPLPGLLAVTGEMDAGNLALVDVYLEPYSRLEWEHSAGKAYEKYASGKMPRPLRLSPGALLSAGAAAVNNSLAMTQNLLVEAMGGTASDVGKVIDPERELLALRGLSGATTKKLRSAVLQCHLRLVAQAENPARAALLLRGLASAYKDISQDNELVMVNRPTQRVVDMVNLYRAPISGSILVSTAEAGKLMQLPTAGLQDEYPQVDQVRVREVDLSPELFLDDVPGIPLGNVTHRGVTRLARIPVDEYPGVKSAHVWDALCTPTLGTGQMGCGKTAGLGGNWAMGFLQNGFTVFLIDTADGQQARELEDALPGDFPDEKIIHLELDNKAWPVALNWGDVASRRLTAADADDELEALELGERLTDRLINYIDNAATAELSDRMRRYLSSCARSTLRDPSKCLLDVELALTSPAYREKLMADPYILAQPDIMADLVNLQRKAEVETDSSIIDPIISRLKIFSETKKLQNLFYQPNKLKAGRPILDFRRFADNPEGGYGYLVAIHASADAFGDDGQQLVLSFVQDKILMAIYSRVDISQDQRRPVLNLVDEPHRIIGRSWHLYKNATVEMRKYRLKLLWLAHYMSQMGHAAQAMAAGGCQFTQYKTQDLRQFSELAHAFEPFDAEELYRSLAEKWEAVNKVRLPSGKDTPAFIAKMAPPPPFVRSREERRQECAREFGWHWKEVAQEIQEKRLRYQRLDEEWREKQSAKK